MKINYIIFNERPFSPLIQSQIIPLLTTLSKNKEITLFQFIQFWNFKSHKKEIIKTRSLLKKNGIKVKFIPFAFPEQLLTNFFLKKVLVSFTTILFKVTLNLNNSNNIYHVRGYFASLILCKIKKNKKKELKIIFDGRSLYPLEGITRKLWNKNSLIYKSWLLSEKIIIQNANITVCINEEIKGYYDKIHSSGEKELVPIFAVKRLTKNTTNLEGKIYNLKLKGKTVFIYSGSLEVDFWNDLNLYADYIKRISTIDNNAYFIIASNSSHKNIQNKFDSINIPKNVYTLISSNPTDVIQLYKLSDFGLQLMPPLEDGFSRLGVKVIEYLINGLNVVTNDNCGSAKNLIKSSGYGFILNLDNEFDNNYKQGVISMKISDMENHILKKFTIDYASSRYLELYNDLTN